MENQGCRLERAAVPNILRLVAVEAAIWAQSAFWDESGENPLRTALLNALYEDEDRG